MKFLLKPRELTCPHCKTIFLTDYRGEAKVRTAMDSGNDIECPHCHQFANYNRKADWVFGAGLLVALVGMPIVFNMKHSPISISSVAATATLLVVIGAWMRRLKKR